MNRRNMLGAIAASFPLLSFALPVNAVAAQGAESFVGTWEIVSTDNVDASGQKTPIFGPNPRGLLTFTANGRYSLMLARTSLPKFAAGNREKGTEDENKAVVAGALSHFGKYTVDDKDKTFTFHVETSTYPNWDGTTQKRPFTISGDELKYTTPAASAGGRADLIWKRIK
jgi:Lipocalin-like domain